MASSWYLLYWFEMVIPLTVNPESRCFLPPGVTQVGRGEENKVQVWAIKECFPHSLSPDAWYIVGTQYKRGWARQLDGSRGLVPNPTT